MRPQFITAICLLALCTSCSWFNDNPTLDLEIYPCSPLPVSTQTEEIHHEKAVVRYLVTNINGDTIKKWVLIPETPENIIYEACNLPDTVKKDWVKLDFWANAIVPAVTHPHDTILHGITHIQLTALKVKENEID